MNNRFTRIALLTTLLVSSLFAADVPVDMNKRAEELKGLKWGMFICWSFSTFSGKEWTPGVTNINFFAAKDVDTDQWARTAKEANMGYILFLTKHHDGFCLWDTKTTDRKVTNAPLGRDVLAELKKSCDKYGIKLALYFSEGEWQSPGGLDHPDTTGQKKANQGGNDPELKKAQLKELLTQYGPIEYIWFDHAVGTGGLSHSNTVEFCKSLQPGCFVGFNHGAQAGADIRLGEMGKPGPLTDHGAAGPHMRDAPASTYRLAEFTYPILPGHKGGAMWFYSLPIHDGLCKSAEALYKDYLGAVKYGNVFALDAGPNYEGKLRDIDVKTLRTVGDMIRNKAPMPEIPELKVLPKKQNTTGSLSFEKKAKASSTWGGGFDAGKAFDGDDESRWGADKDTSSGWLEVDLGKDMEVGCAVVKELGYHRTKDFAIECKDGDNWKELVKGTTIEGEKVFNFKPVTARYFRLNIKTAGGVPTIEEFQLYAPGAKLPESIEKAMQADEKRLARLKWFDQAKYGLFINWGLYSIPAGEWKGKKYPGIGEWIMHDAKIPVKEYELLAQQFNPSKFNADEWAQLAVDAGMKYLVFDCKHHDGFALYHSEVSAYNCFDATPWKRDPFKELQEACSKRGITFCFYYSQATDWHEPNGANNEWDFAPNDKKNFDQYLRDKSIPQIKELLTNYGPIGLIWFDVPTLMKPERCQQLVDVVRAIQPNTLINSRLGPGGLQDYQSRGDNEIPRAVTPGAWETAATINDTWGFKKDDHNWKTPEDICFKLVDIVSKGGNYLLNVGPDGDGAIPKPSQDNLRTVGAWLKTNGEAIYGAGRTPFGDELGSTDPDPAKKDRKGRVVFNAKTDWRCTTQPGKIYFHFFKWPGTTFETPAIAGKVTAAYLLTDRKPLPIKQEGGRAAISLPEKPASPLAAVLCIDV